MRLNDALFLAADTPRSKAYAQAFRAREYRLPKTVIFSAPSSTQPGRGGNPDSPVVDCGVALPDLNIPLETTCAEISDEIEHLDAASVNEPQVRDRIRQAAGDGVELVIYSGYGGQLVSPEILDCGIPFLHAHSGWLPDYPGSTTIYYSILNGDDCGVSAILLTPNIDDGPVVIQKHYPTPPKDVDIDYFYDPAIRADLMAEALSDWNNKTVLLEGLGQSQDLKTAYCVIHPCLKHMARKMVEARAGKPVAADGA